MKKAFLLLCTLLLVLGCALPLAAYHLTRAVLGPAVSTVRLPLSSPESTASAPEISAAYAGDADRFLIQDASTGQVLELSRREYLIGAVAAEMPVSWPDEALKAQAVAAHSYALYCRDHTAPDSIGWLTADPARRQGCLTDPVLRSYWGTAYETNYARLAALVDEVEHTVLLCDGAPACASYFAISNGRTEASENVWGTALPYLVSVDSSTDLAADHYEYALTLSAQQTAQQLAALGLTADLAAPEQWFGTPEYTAAGYVAALPVCGQRITGTALRQASENVWGTALPYLVSVDSSTDLAADHYEYALTLSAQQTAQQLAALGLTADLAAPEQWFGTPEYTAAGYVAALPVCGQRITGTALRQALGLRSTCFTVRYESGAFCFTTKGYGHGVGLSQWGAKALAEQGQNFADILAHYYPGTSLSG